MAESIQFGLQQKQLGRTSISEFFGHVNVGIGPRVEYQCWSLLNFTPGDQKREIFLLGAESYEFFSNSATLFGFTKLML
jgi:hypothetical protein